MLCPGEPRFLLGRGGGLRSPVVSINDLVSPCWCGVVRPRPLPHLSTVCNSVVCHENDPVAHPVPGSVPFHPPRGSWQLSGWGSATATPPPAWQRSNPLGFLPAVALLTAPSRVAPWGSLHPPGPRISPFHGVCALLGGKQGWISMGRRTRWCLGVIQVTLMP